MKNVIVLLLIFFGAETKSQNLFKYNEWYSVLTLRENERLFVTEKSFPYSDTAILLYEFKKSSSKIFFRYFENSFGENPTEKYEPCQLFPRLIKTRNNGFTILKDKKDSIMYDKNGRIVQWYFPTTIMFHRTYPSCKFLYINDTVVYEYSDDGQNNPKQLNKYELDSRKNLRSVREARIDFRHALKDSIDIVNVEFSAVTKFLYSKSGNRLESIQTFVIDDGKETRLSTQTFVYRNGRPIKGYAIDNLTNKIVYVQSYRYKPK